MVPLGEIATTQYGVSTPVAADGKVPIVGMQHIVHGRVLLCDLPRTSLTADDLARYRLADGDVLVNRTNSAAQVGKTGIVLGAEGLSAVFASYIVRLRVNTAKAIPEYVNLWMNTASALKRLRRLATPGVSQYNINAVALKTRFFIPLLPLAQQGKLAAFGALFDDERRTLDATITAKQHFRRAVMQPLLTGKIRFPQFSQTSWRSATIGSLFEVVSRPIDWDESSSYDLLSIRRRSGGVFVRGRIPAEKIATKTLFEVRTGDVLISKMQAVHGAIGLVTSEHDGMKVSGSYVALRPKPDAGVSSEFFAWLTRLPQMYKAALFSSHGVHIEKMTFSLDWYLRTRVSLPEHEDEQSRIVALLNALEREENLLVALTAAIERQKHALLDQLLSGELCLPTND